MQQEASKVVVKEACGYTFAHCSGCLVLPMIEFRTDRLMWIMHVIIAQAWHMMNMAGLA